MRYWIFINFNYRRYRYLVEHTADNERVEHFRIIANNKTLLVESNRPLFRQQDRAAAFLKYVTVVSGRLLAILPLIIYVQLKYFIE